jgi:hypothetical protein
MLSAPTIFGPDRIVTDIGVDFAARGIVSEIVVGDWKTQRLRSPARIVVGLGRGQINDPADTMHSTDGWIDIGGGQVARAHLTRTQTFPVWVHSLGPDGTAVENVEQTARQQTAALLDATCSAIKRTTKGLPLLPWPVEWVDEEEGEFIYGSVVKVDVQIAVPIFDDPSDTMTADEAQTSGQLDIDGTLTPATPETSTAP